MSSKVTYRTHPIQVFLEPRLPLEDLRLLRDYFNLLLEHLRALTDSEFMTTYKYSASAYTRKYLGLSQAKALIETFPYLGLSSGEREQLRGLVQAGNAGGLLLVLRTHARIVRNSLLSFVSLAAQGEPGCSNDT